MGRGAYVGFPSFVAYTGGRQSSIGITTLISITRERSDQASLIKERFGGIVYILFIFSQTLLNPSAVAFWATEGGFEK